MQISKCDYSIPVNKIIIPAIHARVRGRHKT